ncbi:MAG: hypothetical protein HRU18_26955 [Pseudoalteromonas sp.]|uniref:hypothetical protein n=1 Tax=Pseudoalteromonas sp. TaxID=53249 RepID=UPI001D7B9B94|nr:hypothetical protein [Pseudoalteromonas sp.]NRA81853.1 hypothetical protein [Pseudoalteromonas sp.]
MIDLDKPYNQSLSNTLIDLDLTGFDNYQGFADYNDSATSSTPIALLSNNWTTITNDGLGAFSNLNSLPFGVTTLMDTSTGYIDPRQLNIGDSILIRNDFTVTPKVNNSLLKLRYELGTGLGLYQLETIVGRLDSGSGVGYRFALKPDFIYMGDSNTRDNYIKIQVSLENDGTLVNAGSVIQVIKGK